MNNNFELKIDNKYYYNHHIIASGVSGTTIALCYENYNIPTLIGKIYKKNSTLKIKNINKDDYNLLMKNNLVPNFLGRYDLNKNIILKDENNKEIIYEDYIDVYNIAGSLNFNDYIELSEILLNYGNKEKIKDIIKLILDKLDFMVNNTKIIHRDTHNLNIMLKTINSIDFFDIISYYSVLLKNKDNAKDKEKINKQIEDIEFTLKIFLNNINDFEFIKKYITVLTDEEIKEKNNFNYIIPIKDKDLDIQFIDLDLCMNLKTIYNFTKKYDLTNKDIKNIIDLIFLIILQSDKYIFLNHTYNFLKTVNVNTIDLTNFKKLSKNDVKNNVNDIVNFIVNSKKNIYNNIINKSSICKEINNSYISINLIDNIMMLIHYIFSKNNYITQELFDIMFLFIKDKLYLNDELKYFSINNNLFLNFIINNNISTDKSIKNNINNIDTYINDINNNDLILNRENIKSKKKKYLILNRNIIIDKKILNKKISNYKSHHKKNISKK